MDDSKREVYLSRVERESLTVGVTLPDTIELQGLEVPISDIVYNVCSGDNIETYDMEVSEVQVMLRRERTKLVESIEEGEDLSEEEAENIVEKVQYIDRARNALQNPDGDLEQEMKLSEAKRKKRWREFIKNVQEN